MDEIEHQSQSEIRQRLTGEASGEAVSRKATVENQNSVLEYFGHSVNYCGYCKRDETESEGRRSYDTRAHVLRANDYQELLDRGWRRSGTICYRPINSLSCCPNYPLSCHALKFRLSRSQRRCMENMNSFLVNGTIHEKLKLNYGSNHQQRPDTRTRQQSRSFEELKQSPKGRDKRFVASCERKVRLYNITLNESIRKTKMKNIIRYKQHSHTTNLEDYLYPRTTALPETTNDFRSKHSLKIKMHYVDSKDSKALRVDENELIQRYQLEIHKESPEEWTMPRYHNFLINSPLVVEPFQQEYANSDDTLTRRIQKTTTNYLIVEPPDLPTAYGTYHCVYFLDGKLIAVGVLDILPKCITTVYFFYEPEYGYLNLGTYSALVEISIVRQMHEQFISQSELIHYYLGFYVHECKKMHYKTKFFPSYLLCSETRKFVPVETCLKLLKNKKYSRFYMPEATDNQSNHGDYYIQDRANALSIFDIPVITPATSTKRMSDYIVWLNSNFGDDYSGILVENILLPYIGLVGPTLASRIHLELKAVHRALCEKYRKQSDQSPSEVKQL